MTINIHYFCDKDNYMKSNTFVFKNVTDYNYNVKGHIFELKTIDGLAFQIPKDTIVSVTFMRDEDNERYN